MKKLWSVVALMSGLLLVPATASAQAWQMNGGGCVPTDATVSDGAWWVVTKGGRVKHKGQSLKDIKLVCPVTQLSGRPNTLRLYYQDTDGRNDQRQVTAHLRRFDKTTGGLSTPCSIWSQNAGMWRHVDNPACGLIDLSTHIVWIQVVIHREVTGGIVEFNAVELR